MKLVCLLLIVLLLSPLVHALVLPPDIHPGNTHFYSKTKVKSAADKARFKSTGISDYFYKGALFAAELYIPVLIGGAFVGKNVIQEVLGVGLKKVGLTRTGASLSNKLIPPVLKRAPFKNIKDFFAIHKLASAFIVGTFRKRPTPGGLRLGSRIAIEMTGESYFYVSSKVSSNNPHLLAAERHLQNAIDEYNSYTGLLDAFTLTYSKFSPEGYNTILSESFLAIDELNLAKKEKKDTQISTG